MIASEPKVLKKVSMASTSRPQIILVVFCFVFERESDQALRRGGGTEREGERGS